ncbi:ankyrin repeat protein [Necator americanus]|uniref:Ankyrin repeat protein n=1 Tax=Necator americanus TaxID=51031 RepID=W2TM66_NECAM|nr:ankyrin repeat protein [Necator americanus]ETN83210.1 ankyrin repeat protein [Necator americanus]
MKGDLTPLHLAAHNSCRTVVQTLVELGADIEAKDASSRTPLLLAAGSIASNGAFTVEYLVNNNASVDAADDYGHTPLHWAASKGLEKTVEFLLKGGADANRPDNRGRNALHMAVLSRSRATQALLCEANPKIVNHQDSNGFYPLHYAAYKGDDKLCTFLLKLMDNIVEMPTSGVQRAITPLHLAAMHNMPKPLLPLAEAVKKKTVIAQKLTRNRLSLDRPLFAIMDARNRNFEPTKILLSQPGAELCLTWRDKDEMTPLHLAAANGKNTCIEWVLRNFSKISVNRRDSKGRSAGMLSMTSLSGPYWPLIQKSNMERGDNMGRGYLHRAVYSKSEDALKRVLQKCNPNVKDVNGVTPLHVAAAVGWADAVIALLSYGANRIATDNRGFTPIDWAAAYNRLDVLGELIPCSRGSSTDSALGSGAGTTAVTLDTPDDHKLCGRAGLLLASYFGHLSAIVYLLEASYNPNLISARDPHGRTALHLAAWRGCYECVDYLIEKSVSVEAVDDHGATALMYAVKDPKAVHVMLTSYLDKFDPQRVLCNATNDNGET